MFLYLPERPKYAALDLRSFTPDQVAAFIKANAPRSEDEANRAARRH